MKLSVLGATGQTGQFLIRQALQQGHEVTAIVRNPSKMTIEHEKLKVVEADIFSENSLLEHFKGQDVVLSCLGFTPAWFSAVTGYTESMKAVVSAMRQAQVNRVIAMTSWYTAPESTLHSPFLVRFLLIPMIRKVLSNMYQMEHYLSNECSDIDWTVVRPPGLQNAPASDKEFLTHEGYFVPDPNGYPIGNTVARGDVARFMLSLLNAGDSLIKKGVAMITK